MRGNVENLVRRNLKHELQVLVLFRCKMLNKKRTVPLSVLVLPFHYN